MHINETAKNILVSVTCENIHELETLEEFIKQFKCTAGDEDEAAPAKRKYKKRVYENREPYNHGGNKFKQACTLASKENIKFSTAYKKLYRTNPSGKDQLKYRQYQQQQKNIVKNFSPENGTGE